MWTDLTSDVVCMSSVVEGAVSSLTHSAVECVETLFLLAHYPPVSALVSSEVSIVDAYGVPCVRS